VLPPREADHEPGLRCECARLEVHAVDRDANRLGGQVRHRPSGAFVSELQPAARYGRGPKIAVEIEQPHRREIRCGFDDVRSRRQPDDFPVADRPRLAVHPRRALPRDASAVL